MPGEYMFPSLDSMFLGHPDLLGGAPPTPPGGSGTYHFYHKVWASACTGVCILPSVI